MSYVDGADHGASGTEWSDIPPGGSAVRVNVQLKWPAAKSLLAGVIDTPPVREVLNTIRSLGVKLVPVYPESKNKKLQSEFVVDVPDPQLAEEVVDQLNALDATEAVYLKPGDELP